MKRDPQLSVRWGGYTLASQASVAILGGAILGMIFIPLNHTLELTDLELFKVIGGGVVIGGVLGLIAGVFGGTAGGIISFLTHYLGAPLKVVRAVSALSAGIVTGAGGLLVRLEDLHFSLVVAVACSLVAATSALVFLRGLDH